MTLRDVRIRNKLNFKALGIGVTFVILGGVLSALLVLGWILGIILGVAGLFVSLLFQQSELIKTMDHTHTTDVLLAK